MFLAFHYYLLPLIELVNVPDIRGLELESTRYLLHQKGLNLSVEAEHHDPKLPAGHIIKQKPFPGSRLRRGSDIVVIVNQMKKEITVPELRGLDSSLARRQLEQLGLIVGEVTMQLHDTIEKGKIIVSTPEAGAQVYAGSYISLTVSKGLLTDTPNLINKSLAHAYQLLNAQELRVGQIKKVTDINRLFGIVLQQSPAAGTKVEKGSSVDIVINEESIE